METSNLFYPLLLVIVGKNMDAAIELEGRLCAEIEKNFKNDYEEAFVRCRPPGPPGCKDGLCYITEYAKHGGASIASSRILQGFHLMIMSGKYPGPKDNDYGVTTLHEAYHIYQLSHITERDHNLFQQKIGRRTGNYNRDVAWWAEGTADYMALLLHFKQPGVKSKFLKNTMKDKLKQSD